MRTMLVIAVAGLVLVAAGSASAVPYTANFDSDAEGWHGDGELWVATGGQDGGYYQGTRNNYGAYLTPPDTCALYGDVAANIGSTTLTFSYYLKDISGHGAPVALYLFADTDATAGDDTLWQWTPADATAPADWTQYSWTVDTTASGPPAGWTKEWSGAGGTWAESWQNVTYWNFWTHASTGVLNTNGIDTVLVVPEPSMLVLLVGLMGLAFVARRRGT